jgi:hypothetical protein
VNSNKVEDNQFKYRCDDMGRMRVACRANPVLMEGRDVFIVQTLRDPQRWAVIDEDQYLTWYPTRLEAIEAFIRGGHLNKVSQLCDHNHNLAKEIVSGQLDVSQMPMLKLLREHIQQAGVPLKNAVEASHFHVPEPGMSEEDYKRQALIVHARVALNRYEYLTNRTESQDTLVSVGKLILEKLKAER